MALDKRIPNTSSGETAAAGERFASIGELSSTLFEKVLLPIELDSEAMHLTTFAADLAGRFRSQILLLHVVPHEPTLARDSTVIKERRSRLAKIAKSLSDAGALQVQTILLEGSPAIHIEQVARQYNVSLILLADRPEATKAHAWFGTLAQKLARRISVPLMVVKPVGPTTLKPVLCMVDFTESSRKALNYSIALARVLNTTLTVLHVVPEPLPFPLVEGPIWQPFSSPLRVAKSSLAAGSTVTASTERSRRLIVARDELAAFLIEFDLSCVKNNNIVACGSPVLETLTVVKEHKSGVIVLGSDQRSGFVHFMSQNTADTLAETAEVPVLIFRSQPVRPAVLQTRSMGSEANTVH